MAYHETFKTHQIALAVNPIGLTLITHALHDRVGFLRREERRYRERDSAINAEICEKAAAYAQQMVTEIEAVLRGTALGMLEDGTIDPDQVRPFATLPELDRPVWPILLEEPQT